MKKVGDGSANMFRMGWCADYPDAHNMLYDVFHPTDSTNRIQWNNKKFAQLVESASKEPDSQQRLKLYFEAERILNKTSASIFPLFFETAQYLIKPRVKDWYPMPIGGQHIYRWSLEE